jgi:hypothetical protein
MATFTVVRTVDAYATYEAKVEADSPEDAADQAWAAPELYDWQDLDVQTFDDRFYMTLDDQGQEIESTRVGDFC